MEKNSQHSNDTQNHQKPLLQVKCRNYKFWSINMFLLILMLSGALSLGYFFASLGMIVVCIWLTIYLPKMAGTFFFFDKYMEFHPFIYGKKQIYPYEIMKVEVGCGNSGRYIIIRKERPSSKNTWMNNLEIRSFFVAKEEYTPIEHFLAGKAYYFQDNTSGAQNCHKREVVVNEESHKRGMKATKEIYVLLWIFIILELIILALFLYYVVYLGCTNGIKITDNMTPSKVFFIG
jgi:hypothetical protein